MTPEERDNILKQLTPEQRTAIADIYEARLPANYGEALQPIVDELEYMRTFEYTPATGEEAQGYVGEARVQPVQMQPQQPMRAPQIQYSQGIQPIQAPVLYSSQQRGINPQQAMQRLSSFQTTPYGPTFGPQAFGIGNLIR